MRVAGSVLLFTLACGTPWASGQALPSNGEARIIAGRIPEPAAKVKAGPTPRLPDGKPDLGNGKGSWNPRVVENIAGVGPGAPERTPVEKIIDVPFQPWAEQIYNKRIADLQKDDPESRCLP